jgi:CRP-like cAMP-binding protein
MQLDRTAHEQATRVDLLRSLDIFAALTDDERHALAMQLTSKPFAVGDLATKQGDPSDSLYILARGQVGIFRETDEGSRGRQRLTSVRAPSYFGEMGLLTGEARSATIVAESDVLCYRLDKHGFEDIIRARPEIAEAISKAVAERQAANVGTLAMLSAEARAEATGTRAGEIMRRIREFFGL